MNGQYPPRDTRPRVPHRVKALNENAEVEWLEVDARDPEEAIYFAGSRDGYEVLGNVERVEDDK